jgi:glycerol uptake facilitator protein
MSRQPAMLEVLAAEAIGTFMLVLIGGGAGVAATLGGATAGVGLLIAALAHGLALCVIVNIFGRVSGAHVNPAVTIGLASIGRFKWDQVPGYIVAQFVGAFVAALAIVGVYGTKAVTLAAASAPSLVKGASGWEGFLAELLGAAVLVIAVVAAAADTRNNLPSGWAGLVIGLALACGIFLAGAVSGAGLNPALAVSPYLVNTIFGGHSLFAGEIPIYLFGPPIGGVIAAFAYRYVANFTGGASNISTQRKRS